MEQGGTGFTTAPSWKAAKMVKDEQTLRFQGQRVSSIPWLVQSVGHEGMMS